jgi:hypothetical protein
LFFKSENVNPVKYSLNLILTWISAVKTNSDLKNYGDVFVTQKETVEATVPEGYLVTINQSLIGNKFKYKS